MLLVTPLKAKEARSILRAGVKNRHYLQLPGLIPSNWSFASLTMKESPKSLSSVKFFKGEE